MDNHWCALKAGKAFVQPPWADRVGAKPCPSTDLLRILALNNGQPGNPRTRNDLSRKHRQKSTTIGQHSTKSIKSLLCTICVRNIIVFSGFLVFGRSIFDRKTRKPHTHPKTAKNKNSKFTAFVTTAHRAPACSKTLVLHTIWGVAAAAAPGVRQATECHNLQCKLCCIWVALRWCFASLLRLTSNYLGNVCWNLFGFADWRIDGRCCVICEGNSNLSGFAAVNLRRTVKSEAVLMKYSLQPSGKL